MSAPGTLPPWTQASRTLPDRSSQNFYRLKQAVPGIPLRPVVHQGFGDLPLALRAVFGGLDLAPGRRVLAEIALDVVEEGLDLPQGRRQAGFAQPPVAGVEHQRVQLPVPGDDGVMLLPVQRQQFG